MVVWVCSGFSGFSGMGLIGNGEVGLIRFFWVFEVGVDRQ